MSIQANKGSPLSTQVPLQRPATMLARPGPVLAPLSEDLRPALVAEPESSHCSSSGLDQPGAAESLSTKQVYGELQSTGSGLNESKVDPQAGTLREGHAYRWGASECIFVLWYAAACSHCQHAETEC